MAQEIPYYTGASGRFSAPAERIFMNSRSMGSFLDLMRPTYGWLSMAEQFQAKGVEVRPQSSNSAFPRSPLGGR